MKEKQALLNNLVKKLCAEEKGKDQLDAGQARDVINKMAILVATDHEFVSALASYEDMVAAEIKEAKKGKGKS